MSFGRFDPRTLGVASQTFREDFEMKGLLAVSKELAKVKPESWRNFKEGIQSLGSTFGSPLAAARQGFQAPFNQLGAQIGFSVQSAFQPITNQLSGFINQIANRAQPLIQQNLLGAGIGLTAGAIIGSFIPGVGTTIGAILGGFVGAGIGSLFNDDTSFGDALNSQIDDNVTIFGTDRGTGSFGDALQGLINRGVTIRSPFGFDTTGFVMRTSGRLRGL